MQVSMSKKWASKSILDEATGEPLCTAKGKPVLRKSYSVLQDDFFEHMRSAGYDNVERGERGSSEEHLTVMQFKTEREQERLAQLQEASALAQVEADQKNKEAAAAEKKAAQARAKLDDVAPLLKGMEKLAADFSDDSERTLPEAGPLESAKSYREKKAKPLWEKIVKVLRSVYRAYFDLKSRFERLQSAYDREVSKNGSLSTRIYEVCAERDGLKGQVTLIVLLGVADLGFGQPHISCVDTVNTVASRHRQKSSCFRCWVVDRGRKFRGGTSCGKCNNPL